MLGEGVYVTRDKSKAEGYRTHHPNASAGAAPVNPLLQSGEPDPGCILEFRARIGVCKTFTRDGPGPRHSSYFSWHGDEVPESMRTSSVERAVAAATRRSGGVSMSALQSTSRTPMPTLESYRVDDLEYGSVSRDSTAGLVEQRSGKIGRSDATSEESDDENSADEAELPELTYNSAFTAGCSCCQTHGAGCPGSP